MSKLSQRWKSIQGNMSLEGHFISDNELANIAAEYEASGEEELLTKASEIAKDSGRSIIEVIEELRCGKLRPQCRRPLGPETLHRSLSTFGRNSPGTVHRTVPTSFLRQP